MMRRTWQPPEHELSMVDRCRLLGLARSTTYYETQGPSVVELRFPLELRFEPINGLGEFSRPHP